MIIPGYEGKRLIPGTAEYNLANDLYATSTYGKERNMNPSEILQPSSIRDIHLVVRAATALNRPIAIRSGGHQYSGASSTGPPGVQLDLSPTFRRANIDLQLVRDTVNQKVYLKASVSWTLAEIFVFLQANGIFMPTGLCVTVCGGGHIQTGGYGMLARSFGLLGDYVRELDIVDHNGEVVKLNKDTHPELFYGFLGGSPGNLGVLTHVKIEVQEDTKYKGSKGLWQAFYYQQDTLKTILDILVEKGEDPNFPRGYDFTVNVVSKEFNLLDVYPGSEDELKEKLHFIHHGKDNDADLRKFKHALIVVYAQWVNFGDPYSSELFDRIKNVPGDKFGKESPPNAPMSAIASMWLFKGKREFPYPYVKRINSTKSVALSASGWSDWFSGRINEIVKNKDNRLWVVSQLQVYGGKHSMFQKNANNGTSYCFRDATFVGSWDIFHQDAEEAAKQWQEENDKGVVKYYSDKDRRVLWGSYGCWDMKKVWQFYYDPDTYKKMQQIRKTYDPKGIFTANPFAVEALK